MACGHSYAFAFMLHFHHSAHPVRELASSSYAAILVSRLRMSWNYGRPSSNDLAESETLLRVSVEGNVWRHFLRVLRHFGKVQLPESL